MSSLMHEIDGREGGENPPRLERTWRVFHRPIYKASSACALRFSGAANSCEYVRSRAVAVVDYIWQEPPPPVNSGLIARVVDPIRPV